MTKGEPELGEANSTKGHKTFLFLLLPLQSTSKRQARQKEMKTNTENFPVSKLPTDTPTEPSTMQADTNSRSDPTAFYRENALDQLVHQHPDRPEDHHKERKEKQTQKVCNFATDAIELRR